ncbi:hypothetical protein ScalyP_jg5119 [Parmales sp. scaly parma]|nr:hypothetical protein ScalyP_jg5119 [Parmales sp. scaly parma]
MALASYQININNKTILLFLVVLLLPNSNTYASDQYPRDALSCYSTLLAPRSTQFNELICPEFANKWCVKVKVDLSSALYCGKTFFGDSWWEEKSECVYKKCSETCVTGMTVVPANGLMPAHYRETFCCGPHNAENAGEGSLCNGGGRLGVGALTAAGLSVIMACLLNMW